MKRDCYNTPRQSDDGSHGIFSKIWWGFGAGYAHPKPPLLPFLLR